MVLIVADKFYADFQDLPEWVTTIVRQIRAEDAESWVFRPVPALDNRSVMDWMNAGDDGQNRVRQYLCDVAGRFF